MKCRTFQSIIYPADKNNFTGISSILAWGKSRVGLPPFFIVLFFIQNISLFLFNNFSSSKTLFKPFAYFPAQFFLAALPIQRFVLRILTILPFSFSLKFNYSGWSWTPFFFRIYWWIISYSAEPGNEIDRYHIKNMRAIYHRFDGVLLHPPNIVNASWLGALSQSEGAKYFEWIIVINVFYLRYFIFISCSFMFIEHFDISL